MVTDSKHIARDFHVLKFREHRLLVKKYASLWFVMGVEQEENTLLCLHALHQYVLLLDAYFKNVCELDVIFNFNRAVYLLDFFIRDGQVMEPDREVILARLQAADQMEGDKLVSSALAYEDE